MRTPRSFTIPAAMALLALTSAPCVHADPAPPLLGNFVAKFSIPVDTVAADPNTMEDVHITGSISAKTIVHYIPPNPIKVLTSFKPGKDLTGVGMTSGSRYRIKGKGIQKYDWYPGLPIKAVDHTGILVAIPPNPVVPPNPVIPPNPIRVHLHVDYDALTGNAVGSTVDFPTSALPSTCTATAQVCN